MKYIGNLPLCQCVLRVDGLRT